MEPVVEVTGGAGTVKFAVGAADTPEGFLSGVSKVFGQPEDKIVFTDERGLVKQPISVLASARSLQAEFPNDANICFKISITGPVLGGGSSSSTSSARSGRKALVVPGGGNHWKLGLDAKIPRVMPRDPTTGVYILRSKGARTQDTPSAEGSSNGELIVCHFMYLLCHLAVCTSTAVILG